MLIRLLALTPENQLQVFAFFLVIPFYHGEPRNSPLYLVPQLKLSIGLLLLQSVKLCGSHNYYETFKYLPHLRLFYFATIRLLSTLPPILHSMNGPNRLTGILFATKSLKDPSSSCQFAQLTNLLICLPSLFHRLRCLLFFPRWL